MATVAIQKPADVGRDSAFVGGGHSQSSTTSPTTKSSSSVGKESLKREEEEEVDEEKNHIAHVVGQKGNVLATPLPPSEIAKDPEEKDIGWSSKRLGLDDFELIRTLGTGTFARVWLVRLKDCAEKAGDQVYAMKVLRKADIIRLKQVEHVQNERAALASVAGHPFITTMITSFANQDCLYMLLNYCPGGEVFTYLRRQHRFDVPTARFYAAEILLTLEFLHESQGVAYRDLKPENLLIDSDGHIKLVDFGFAKRLGNDATYTLCGTPEYIAPEVIQGKGHGTAVDWWAFGVLIYEFLVGQSPFWDGNPMKIYEKIVHSPVAFPSQLDIPDEAQSLIRGLCTVDRSHRLGNLSEGARQIKNHPFFRDKIDWDALYYRRMKGPIVPKLSHSADTSCFEQYPDEDEGSKAKAVYTEEMRKVYDDAFKEF